MKGATWPALVPGAQFVELPGNDHLPFVGDQDAIIDEIAAFLISADQRQEPDRVLATVLYGRIDQGPTAGSDGAFEAHVRSEIGWFRGRGLTLTSGGPRRGVRRAGSSDRLRAGARRCRTAFWPLGTLRPRHRGVRSNAGRTCRGPRVRTRAHRLRTRGGR
jgi:hypothetical protein